MRSLLAILFLASVTSRGAALFASASSQSGQMTNLPTLTTYPITLHCTITVNTLASHTFVSVCSSTTERVQLDVDSSGFFAARSINSSGSGSTAFVGGGSTGVVYRITGVFASASSRILYTNGVFADDATNSFPVANLNRVILGSRLNAGSLGNYHNGLLQGVAVWNVALTADEVATLGSPKDPISPLEVRFRNLVFYSPLDIVGPGGAYSAVSDRVAWGNAPSSTDSVRMMLP